MTTVPLVTERLKELLLAEGSPARCAGEVLDVVEKLLSELDLIRKQLEADEDELKVNEDEGNSITRKAKQKLTQLSYDIENAVESYVGQKDEAGTKGNSGRKLLGSCLTSCLTKHRFSLTEAILQDISVIQGRIDDLRLPEKTEIDAAAAGGSTGQRSSDVVQFGTSHSEDPPQHQASHSRPRPFPLIGIDPYLDKLKSLLLEEKPKKLSVIAVCGQGGLGKTALVRKLYSDGLRKITLARKLDDKPLMLGKFSSCAWATVGTEFQVKDILQSLLFSLDSSPRSKDEIARMETTELVKELYRAQNGKAYLIVLDDIRSKEAWDALRIAFPDDSNGSRIIITTREKDVARRITTSILEMQPLDEKSRYKLLGMRSGTHGYWDLIEETGKKIASLCEGIPVALNVVGSSLSKTKTEDWGVMLLRLQGYMGKNQYSTEGIYGFIYNYIPFHLKPCFLYLGHFPPHQAITKEKLYLLWMAEGLIPLQPPNHKTQMEAAQDYLNELFREPHMT